MSEEMVVVARNPSEMQVAQQELIAWVDGKMEETKLEKEEAEENLAIAVKNKWRTQGLKSMVRKATQRFEYYEKLKTALKAGYVIVPNFDLDIFAIRTERTKPKGHTRMTEGGSWRPMEGSDFTQHSEKPKLGSGEYVDPEPTVDRDVEVRELDDGKTKKVHLGSPEEFRPPDFPFKLVKPRIMDDTAKAMALKVFDQIGVIPYRRQKADPMVIGQVLCGDRTVSFLITWWLREADLEV